MIQIRNKVAVAGVGMTRFGRLPGQDPYDLGLEAFRAALDDCGLVKDDIDGLIVSRIPDYQRFGNTAGLNPRFAQVIQGSGRMSGACIGLAVSAIVTGLATTVALVYGNNGRSGGDKYGGGGDAYSIDGASAYGMTSPGALHAMMFQRHAAEYGTTSRQLAEIAVSFRNHAVLNPDAVMKTPITVAEHQASRFIAEPLHLFDYCLINDGGVALILTSAERARDLRRPPVYIRGHAQAAQLRDSFIPPDDYWYAPMQRVAADVYRMADVGRDDLDALMIYDNFSPTVLFTLEGFGFCDRGESGAFVEDGCLRLGGRYPTNTDGGHLSNSYMQGWALNVEAVRQLRGENGVRQVEGANLIQFMAASPICSSVIYGRESR